MILIGIGKDIHNLTISSQKKDLTLGGIKFDNQYTILSHSDGDVIYHALSNAILSAIGLNDIGCYFSDQDDKNKNMSSEIILDFALHKMKEKKLFFNNIALCITCQHIKINPIKQKIVENLEKKLTPFFYDDKALISLHATTYENNNIYQIECLCNLILKN